MKLHLPNFLKLKPILFGITIFSLMWMVMLEVNFRYEYYNGINGWYGSHVTPGLYYRHISYSVPLIIASVALFHKRIWSQTIALILSGLVFLDRLFYDFLVL